MLSNNKTKNDSNGFSQEINYVEINFATGDQFKKIDTLYSENGPVTKDQIIKFRDEASKEARKWFKNHPRKSVAIRILRDEDGNQKQVIEAIPKKDLICPSNFRTRIYDQQSGKLIVGEENIRAEIERRTERIEKWREEGKIEVASHEVHHTNDGSTVSVIFRTYPAGSVHPNEINDETNWIPLMGGKKLESDEASQQSGTRVIEGSSEQENNKDRSIVEKILKNIKEWSVQEIDFGLISGVKGKQDCLVHNSAKVNINELGKLIYPVEVFDDSERAELAKDLNHAFAINNPAFPRKKKEEILRNYHSVSLSKFSKLGDNPQKKNINGESGLIIFGVAFVSLVAGLVIVRRKFIKKNPNL